MRCLGALAELGAPVSDLNLSVLLSPTAIHAYVNWYRDRRGAYTRTIIHTLWTIGSIIHPEHGYLTQKPEDFEPVPLLLGLTKQHEVDRAQRDWKVACAIAYGETRKVCKDIQNNGLVKGRDPFDAILPVLNAAEPLKAYYRIVQEIRRQMPDTTYPASWAEAQRALWMFRLGVVTSFRQRNLREMLLRPLGNPPLKASALAKKRVMEIGFDDNGLLVIRAPREALKNFYSSVVKEVDADKPIILQDEENLYADFRSYLLAREILLNGSADPATLFVNGMRSRASDPCMGQTAFYQAFVAAVRRYGIRNPFNGRGAIERLRPHGPHAGFRDVVATQILKTGGSISMAADALLDSEETIRAHYGRYLPHDRFGAAHAFARKDLYGDWT